MDNRERFRQWLSKNAYYVPAGKDDEIADAAARIWGDPGEAAGNVDEQQWQPIETAPKYEHVLLWWPYWSSMPVIGRLWGGHWDSCCALSAGDPPTHWMRLPKPPTTEQTK